MDAKKKEPLWTRLVHELRAYWIIVVYLSVFFGVFTMFERLVLARHGIAMQQYGVAFIKALVLGKVVLIADKLGVGRRFEDKPLSIPTLWSTCIFTLCTLLFRIAEVAIEHLIHAGTSGLGVAIVELFDKRLLANALVVFASFIPFFAVRELTRVLGEGKLTSLFFLSSRSGSR